MLSNADSGITHLSGFTLTLWRDGWVGSEGNPAPIFTLLMKTVYL